MPLARYFLLVGGALLALLFVAGALMPTVPVGDGANSSSVTIRIRSDVRWPERVVYDTSLPTIVPPQAAGTESGAQVPSTATEAHISANARESLAQLLPPEAIRPRPSDTTKRDVKPQHQRKQARRRAVPQDYVRMRQAQFGWFGYYGAW